MTDTTRIIAARTLWIIGICLAALNIAFAISSFPITNRQYSAGDAVFFIVTALVSVAYGTVGMLVTTRRGSVLGWIFGVIGLCFALGPFAEEYVLFATVTRPGSLPGPQWVHPLTSAYGIGAASIALVLLLFPDGHLPSRRWRWVLWTLPTAVFVGVVAFSLLPGAENGTQRDLGVRLINPIGIEGAHQTLSVIDAIAAPIAVVSGLLCIVALFLRFRRSEGEERQQMRWVAYSGAAVIALFLLTAASGIAFGEGTVNNVVWGLMVLIIGLGIPIAFAIAIMRYRLYDLDIVVKKTVVFALIATFTTLVYVVALVAIPTLIVGVGSGGTFSPLTFATTILIALLFQPVRRRARKLADRLVYGRRATPYEVLSEFSDRLSEAYSTDDVLPRLAQLLAAGTGATVAGVWLRVGDRFVPTAVAPATATIPTAVASTGDDLPAFGERTSAVPVRHQGDLLGAITLEMPANDPMNPEKERLVLDVAAQAGLVLRNVQLIEELRASRRRIVTAQDERAKKLERNIHDGAQQHLVALAVKLRLARTTVASDPAKAGTMLDDLQSEANDALENLRDLARGIYPPLLADKGLPEALTAQARKSPVPVDVESDGVGRYPPEIESAIYFCCLEALQNIGKYAGASRAEIRLAQANGHIRFEVIDDGSGFDTTSQRTGTGLQGMADRLEAIGGSLDVRSEPGRGTTVTGTVPATQGAAR
ncbi:MAG: histidine kinase [Actinomycetota bacterium]